MRRVFYSGLRLGILSLLVLGGCNSDSDDSVSPEDKTAPTIAARLPGSGASGVSVSTRITITFSEPIAPASATTGTVMLNGPNGPVSGTVSASGSTVTFAPAIPLAESTTYTANVSTGIADLAGNTLAAFSTWSFTTAQPAPPALVSTTPTNNATGVSLTADIQAVFSEPVDPNTVNTATFQLVGPNGPVSGIVTSNDTRVTFNPSTSLDADKQYTATLTTGIRDLQGLALTAPANWSFTTKTLPVSKPDNYVFQGGGSGIVRWQTSKLPLRIYRPDLPSDIGEPWRTWLTLRFDEAINAWDNIIPGVPDVANFTTNRSQADLEIHWRRDFTGNPFGRVTWNFGPGRAIIGGIEIGFRETIEGPEEWSYDYFHNLAHELGHVLGIIGHSGVYTDLMYGSGTDDNEAISDRDRQAIRWLYQQTSFTPITVGNYVPSLVSDEQRALGGCSLAH